MSSPPLARLPGHAPADRPRRVLFVSHEPALIGGAERSLLELIAGLEPDPTIECLVAARSEGPLLDAAAAAGATTVVIPTPTWVVSDAPVVGANAPTTGAVLRRCIRVLPRWLLMLSQRRPDVVVTSTSTIPTPALAARLLGIDHIWMVTELLRQHPDRRYVLGPRLTTRLIDRLAKRLVVSSAAVADSLTGVPRTRMRVIHPSCALPPAEDPPFAGDPSRPLRLLLMARFEPGKGAETAIAAVNLARQAGADIELRLVGPAHPRYRARLERQGEQSAARDRITWSEPTDDPASQLDWSDVVLVPTTIDAYGRVTAEAMRRGRPVVGAAVGGTLELVEDGHNGVLFPPDDVPALADVLSRLAGDRHEVARLAEAAWESGQSAFSPERRIRLFCAVLDEL